MNEEHVAQPLPCRCLSDGFEGTVSEVFGCGGLNLFQGGFQREVTAQPPPFQRSAQLAVVIAENEHAPVRLQQVQHGFQHASTVRPVIDEISQLDDEALCGYGMAESVEITVHVSHNAKTMLTNAG